MSHVEKVSPDVFLSRNGIKYDGTGLPGSPAEIVSALIKLNDVRTWNNEINNFEYFTYSTPDFRPSPISPNTFNITNINANRRAIEHYNEIIKTGNLEKTHQAVDEINAIRSANGGIQFTPQSDFEILTHGMGSVGRIARYLISDALNNPESGPPGENWFFSKKGYAAILDYVRSYEE